MAIFAGVVLLVLVATGTVLKAVIASDTSTPLYSRCRNYANWHPCLDNKNYECLAKKVPSDAFQDSSFRCSTRCPPTVEKIQLTFYKRKIFTNLEKEYTGINLSWSLDTQDISYLQLVGFSLSLSTHDRYQIKHIKAPVEKQPIDDNGKIWFFYDCFFPIIKNRTWILAVQRLPYQNETDEKIIAFALDENGDPVVTTTKDICKDRHVNPAGSIQRISSESAADAAPDVNLQYTERTSLVTGNLIIGVTVGSVFIIIAVTVAIICRRSKTHSADNSAAVISKNNMSSTYDDSGTVSSEAGVRPTEVVLVYDRDLPSHIHRSRDLMAAVNDICHVSDIWQVAGLTGCRGDGGCHSETVSALIRAADVVVIVLCLRFDAFLAERRMRDEHLPTGHHRLDDVALRAVVSRENDASFRIVTVCYPEGGDPSATHRIPKWPPPLAFPSQVDALRRRLLSTRSCDGGKRWCRLDPTALESDCIRCDDAAFPGNGRPKLQHACHSQLVAAVDQNQLRVFDTPYPHSTLHNKDTTVEFSSAGCSEADYEGRQLHDFVPPRNCNSIDTDLMSTLLDSINSEDPQSSWHTDGTPSLGQVPSERTTSVRLLPTNWNDDMRSTSKI